MRVADKETVGGDGNFWTDSDDSHHSEDNHESSEFSLGIVWVVRFVPRPAPRLLRTRDG